MLRVSKRNSEEDQRTKDLDELQKDLEKCKHRTDKLKVKQLREKLKSNHEGIPTDDKESESKGTTITAVVDQFQEIKELKGLFKGLESDIDHIVGEETRVLVATRKGQSIANRVVKNKHLCQTDPTPSSTQQCGGKNCQSCQLLQGRKGESTVVNGIQVKVPNKNLTCKTQNVVYLAQCRLCEGEAAPAERDYAGQTLQRMHLRINGHRNCFDKDDQEAVEKSALALHAYEKHPDNFDLKNFKFTILDSVSPCSLNRREARAINELRTNVLGLNRMNVQKYIFNFKQLFRLRWITQVSELFRFALILVCFWQLL